MPSELQRDASRLNGAKSRGPVTIEGKRNASRSAIRHGLIAHSVVIDNESLPRFKSLLAALCSELDPRGEIESALVETMAVTRWRQLRLWALEKSALDDEIRRQEPDTSHKDPATRAFLAFRGIVDQSRSLELINRDETRFDRQFLRCVRHFERVRAGREQPAQYIKISERTQQCDENKEAA